MSDPLPFFQRKTPYRAELLELKEICAKQLRQIVKLNLLVQHINEGVPLTKDKLHQSSVLKDLSKTVAKDKTPTGCRS